MASAEVDFALKRDPVGFCNAPLCCTAYLKFIVSTGYLVKMSLYN